jgi:membrane-bound lytic murein transglycosylase MltF
VLRASGLAVEPSSTYEGLFAMLARGRVDYVPRGAHEVAAELVAHADLPLQLEPTLLVHYPSALYFFVHPGNDTLALALERGLEQSVADGSLRRLFDQAYGSLIAAGQLARRTRIELPNPTLPAATPLARRELWFEPGAPP